MCEYYVDKDFDEPFFFYLQLTKTYQIEVKVSYVSKCTNIQLVTSCLCLICPLTMDTSVSLQTT